MTRHGHGVLDAHDSAHWITAEVLRPSIPETGPPRAYRGVSVPEEGLKMKRLIFLVGFSILTVGCDMRGRDGVAGPAGADGRSGASGTDGSAGAKGDDGKSGADGATGQNGAKGAAGAEGATGADGAKGATGQPGDRRY
jgi:hypothetical protein